MRSLIYVASRASVPERSAMWRRLRDEGWPIISTWIDESEEAATRDFGELWERICDEIDGADYLILYAEPNDFPLKGAFVEVGMAIAFEVPVIAVLPGVVLERRSMRPVGSWLCHPLVSIVPDLEEAKNLIQLVEGSTVLREGLERAERAINKFSAETSEGKRNGT